jgi:hypothetical protein
VPAARSGTPLNEAFPVTTDAGLTRRNTILAGLPEPVGEVAQCLARTAASPTPAV